MIGNVEFPFGEIQAGAAMLTPAGMVRADKQRPRKAHRDHDMTLLVDSTLEHSFPASDPPSWTTSVARPAPARKVLVRVGDAGPIRRFLQRAAALF